MKIQLTNFSKRHFKTSFIGTKITNINEEEFEKHINTLNNSAKIIDGYAPFCKLMIIPNFTNAKTGTMEITVDNFHNIRTDYVARTEEELPVLTRWLQVSSTVVPTAKYLVVVLYSYEQLLFENNKKQEIFELDSDTDYGIVAILGQMINEEEPMKPITMIRNSMGVEQGGSGVPLDKEKYLESVKFWTKYANIKTF